MDFIPVMSACGPASQSFFDCISRFDYCGIDCRSISEHIDRMKKKAWEPYLSARSTHRGSGMPFTVERTTQKPHAEYAPHRQPTPQGADHRSTYISTRHLSLSQSWQWVKFTRFLCVKKERRINAYWLSCLPSRPHIPWPGFRVAVWHRKVTNYFQHKQQPYRR